MNATTGYDSRASYVYNFILITSIFIWGMNVSVVALLLRHFSPLVLATCRMTLGATAFCLTAFVIDGNLKVSRKEIPLLVAGGILFYADQTSFVLSLTDSDAGTVSLLLATTPIFVMWFAKFTVGYEISWRHWGVIAVGSVGVTITVLCGGQHFSFRHAMGDIFALSAAIASAAYLLVLKPLVKRHSIYKLSSYVFALAGVLTAISGIRQLTLQHWNGVPLSIWGELVGSVLFSTVLANAFFAAGVRFIDPLRVAMFTYLQPVVGVLAASVLVAAHVSLLELLGGLMIIGAVIMSPGEAASRGRAEAARSSRAPPRSR
jgi:drug/metabolite transporter (DMT)-like permease